MNANLALRNALRNFIFAADGRMVTVDFVKKDGSLRTLNGRLGVGSGKRRPSTKHMDNYMVIYDVRKQGYRNVNLDTVRRVAANKAELRVEV